MALVNSNLITGLAKPQTGNLSNSIWGAQYNAGGNQAQSTPAPNMSTIAGPKYAPPPVLGSIGTTPVVKHTIGADGTQSVTHAAPDAGATNSSTSSAKYTPPEAPGTQTVQGGILSAPGYGGANGTPTDTSNGTFTTPNGATVNGAGSIITPSPQNNPTFSGLVGSLVNSANQNQNIGQQAQGIANQFAPQMAAITKGATGQIVGDKTTGTSPVGEGNAAIASSAAGSLLSGLSSAENAQLAALSPQLTAQSQQQSGLTSAVNASQPNTASYGQTVFNPLTGQYENGGGLPAEVLQSYAQMAANGQYSAIPSSITSNPVLSAQLNAAAKAINPNYSPITSTAQGNAAASNVQSSGTAPTQAAAAGLQQATQQYVDANTAYTTAQQQANSLQQVLQKTGINSNPQFINQTINNLQNQLGSADYTSYITTLTELQQKYSNLLSSVGAQTPTVNGNQALTILNPNSTPVQINAAIDALNQAAFNTLQPLFAKIGTYAGQLNPTGNTNATTNTTANPWH